LDITTLEGKSVTVTAWVNGFFVNGSTTTQFNPEPAAISYESHALVDLLNSVSNLNHIHIIQVNLLKLFFFTICN